MERHIPESDWKLFRMLREVALDRFCERVIGEVAGLAANSEKSNHERYLEIFRLLRERDEELASAFNDVRRSTALMKLTIIQAHQLLTTEEFGRFSPETRASVETILEIRDEWRK